MPEACNAPQDLLRRYGSTWRSCAERGARAEKLLMTERMSKGLGKGAPLPLVGACCGGIKKQSSREERQRFGTTHCRAAGLLACTLQLIWRVGAGNALHIHNLAGTIKAAECDCFQTRGPPTQGTPCGA